MYQNDETKNRICIVTGAESELGKASALALARVGSTVVLVCRDRGAGEKLSAEVAEAASSNTVSAAECDLSSLASVRAFVDRFTAEHPWLDVIVHNETDFDAGAERPEITESGTERVFTTNYLAPFLLTNLLIGWLERGHTPRIIGTVPVSLAMYPRLAVDFDNLNGEKRFDPAHAYYQAKLAHLMFIRELAHRLDGSKILPFCVGVPRAGLEMDRLSGSPGLIKRTRRRAALSSFSAADTANTFLWLATSKEAEGFSGKWIDERHRTLRVPKSANDGKTRLRLWDRSLRLAGLGTGAAKQAEKIEV
jgi:NAD(P)-dependent dehydrogenase (short-subunit alcohol dehydrogenase family)